MNRDFWRGFALMLFWSQWLVMLWRVLNGKPPGASVLTALVAVLIYAWAVSRRPR